VIVGVPYTEPAVNTTRSGGTPYGASHVASAVPEGELSEQEGELARALGRRVASIALKLKGA
jgi:NAD(P)H dehydrogenase (quinone)